LHGDDGLEPLREPLGVGRLAEFLQARGSCRQRSAGERLTNGLQRARRLRRFLANGLDVDRCLTDGQPDR
jgi:hypothetical protein